MEEREGSHKAGPRKNKGDKESGGKRKESTGKKVEVVWACHEKHYVGRRVMEMKAQVRKEERKV